MKGIVMSAILAVIFFACNKKEPAPADTVGETLKNAVSAICGKEIVATKPVKAGETGIFLPPGSKLCISADKLEVRVELPEGYAFLTKDADAMSRPLPVFATYACYCSAMGSACMVFYDESLGFGCIQSSCSGSCTGKFTYKGYTVDRVISTSSKESFFQIPEVQDAIRKIASTEPYSKESVYGVPFYLVNDAKIFLPKASCDCEGTRACTLKTVTIPGPKPGQASKNIYYCEGPCNGCELTVD